MSAQIKFSRSTVTSVDLRLTGPCYGGIDETVAAVGSAFGAGLTHLTMRLGDSDVAGTVGPSFWEALATHKHLPHLSSFCLVDDAYRTNTLPLLPSDSVDALQQLVASIAKPLDITLVFKHNRIPALTQLRAQLQATTRADGSPSLASVRAVYVDREWQEHELGEGVQDE